MPAPPDPAGSAVGNVEDARVAADVLGRALDGALYLDDDALERAAPAAATARVLQAGWWGHWGGGAAGGGRCAAPSAPIQPSNTHPSTPQTQQRRLLELKVELEDARACQRAADAARLAAEARVAELEAEAVDARGAGGGWEWEGAVEGAGSARKGRARVGGAWVRRPPQRGGVTPPPRRPDAAPRPPAPSRAPPDRPLPPQPPPWTRTCKSWWPRRTRWRGSRRW